MPDVMEVRLDELGEGVTEAYVVRWICQPGDAVSAGEPLVEMMTDKVNTDIAAPVTGVVREVRFAEEDRVQVGEVLATIEQTYR